MFTKILIANRGEIACRVMRTAKRMGIATVAVYSDADKDALHVQMADEAVHIGPPPSAQSYLMIDRIVDACKKTGAQAVHPGYGFLSEKREFQEALAKAGIAFIGPDAHAIFAMGDKIESKKLAQKAGVSSVPGYLGAIPTVDEAIKIARDVGYPVMIKASAGGGGKGMRLAHNDAEVKEGFQSARNEAKSSFADDRVFIEKYIEQPRHIEIQVLGDSHGNVIYLGERECSIQRRHQKVIEEAPSPFLTPEVRKAMGEQAVALAKAVNYKSAGTVEFIVDAKRNFFFLEMNTRLQVEHPVTELVTGLDLVEWMIRIANGEKLTVEQSDVKANGWAIEARVYAEDPYRNFLPSVGRLTRYSPPAVNDHVRVDTGVYEGGEISIHYDPMIAKLCSWGKDRNEAIKYMLGALDDYVVRGLNHNIAFLSALVGHPRFARGELTTNFIADEFPKGFHGVEASPSQLRHLAAVAAFAQYRAAQRETSISGQLAGHEAKIGTEGAIRIGDQPMPFKIEAGGGGVTVALDGKSIAVKSDWLPGQLLLRATIDDGSAHSIAVQIERDGLRWRLSHNGIRIDAAVLRSRIADLAVRMPVKAPPDLSRFLLSPMPGLLVSVPVSVGQEVKAGEVLAVVEAMKMENVLRAERDGVIGMVNAKAGDSLAVDQRILEFK
ncbi:MAG TPA: acetyl/propionyl/methylcrotonyl-CoA carboxylase subunit alpha [Magnetospirillaceae bacterium]